MKFACTRPRRSEEPRSPAAFSAEALSWPGFTRRTWRAVRRRETGGTGGFLHAAQQKPRSISAATSEEPDLVVVMDDSLLKEARAQVFHGVYAGTSGGSSAPRLPARAGDDAKERPAANFVFLDLSSMARGLMGRDFVSAAAAGVAAKCVPGDFCRHSGRSRRGLKSRSSGSRKSSSTKTLPPHAKPMPARRVYPPVYTPGTAAELGCFTGASALSTFAAVHEPYHSSSGQRRVAQRRRLAHGAAGDRPSPMQAPASFCYLYCPDAAIRLDSDNFPGIRPTITAKAA